MADSPRATLPDPHIEQQIFKTSDLKSTERVDFCWFPHGSILRGQLGHVDHPCEHNDLRNETTGRQLCSEVKENSMSITYFPVSLWSLADGLGAMPHVTKRSSLSVACGAFLLFGATKPQKSSSLSMIKPSSNRRPVSWNQKDNPTLF